MGDNGLKLAYAMCGSFCTHKNALEALRILAKDNEIVPAVSEITAVSDTRFGTASSLISELKSITGSDPIRTIPRAEEVITRGNFDAVIVSPCTGNTLAKIASGITDSTVTMCVKAQLRSKRKVLIALATNDGLSGNLFNIAMTLERKNIYFVPFGQDAPTEKPSSLICDFNLLPMALGSALAGVQLQPILTT